MIEVSDLALNLQFFQPNITRLSNFVAK